MIALQNVPLVNGERRCLRSDLVQYAPPARIYLQENDDVVVYYDGDSMPPDQPVPNIPLAVTRAQFRLALAQLGLLGDVEAAVAASAVSVQIEYADRQEFNRYNPLVVAMAAELNKLPQEIDAVFELAATL